MMVTKNPRTLLLIMLFALTVSLAVACGSDEPQADVASVPVAVGETAAATAESATGENISDDSADGETLLVVPTAASEVDAGVDQPESPLGAAAPQLSPLNAANTAQHAKAIASRRTLAMGTPAPGMGNVRGSFLANTPNSLIYLAGDIYLAPVVFSEGEVSLPFISLNVGVDPIATERTATGEFVFENVKPGLYGIVLYTAAGQYLAPDSAGIDVLYIEVESGQTLELDDILIH